MAGKSRPPYPPACRAEAVRLVRSGSASPTPVAKDLGVHHETLRLWLKQADTDEGRRAGLTTAEREERSRPRREDRILKQEREGLVNAAAFVAQERAIR